ncbi:MAG: hypothetical protein ACJ768_19595 [Gaiellaceae bacterium]
MSPFHRRKTDATEGAAAYTWRLVKEVGGPAVIVAAIFFAARIDSNIVATVKAIDKLSSVVDGLGKDQNALSVQLARQSQTIAEDRRRIEQLEQLVQWEASRGHR